MNGVYDFERYKPPYLDTQMLEKRKLQKREKWLLLLSGIAMVLVAILAALVLYMVWKWAKDLFFMLLIIFSGYIIIQTVVIRKFIKKEVYLC